MEKHICRQLGNDCLVVFNKSTYCQQKQPVASTYGDGRLFHVLKKLDAATLCVQPSVMLRSSSFIPGRCQLADTGHQLKVACRQLAQFFFAEQQQHNHQLCQLGVPSFKGSKQQDYEKCKYLSENQESYICQEKKLRIHKLSHY